MDATPRVEITRKARFCAAHRYHREDWTDAKNQEVFGSCNNPFGHGHNYEIEVTITGDVDPETGMVLNLREVDAIVQGEIVARFDHRHINEEIDEFRNTVPTTENLVLYAWRRLAPVFADRGVRLCRVRLREDPFLWAEFRGDEA